MEHISLWNTMEMEIRIVYAFGSTSFLFVDGEYWRFDGWYTYYFIRFIYTANENKKKDLSIGICFDSTY